MPWRESDDREANAGSGNATGTRDQVASPSSWRSRITGRISGLVPGPERVLTRSGEPVKRKMIEIPEPKDKLDATATVAVSGPEDDAERWRQIDWRRVEADVRRLRQRIFTASKAGDLARVRNLRKLMLRSRANTLLGVRRVTERNAGRLTAGVDGEVVLTPEAKDWPTGCTRTPNRSRPSPVTARYFGKFNKARQDRWVFGDRYRSRLVPTVPTALPVSRLKRRWSHRGSSR